MRTQPSKLMHNLILIPVLWFGVSLLGARDLTTEELQQGAMSIWRQLDSSLESLGENHPLPQMYGQVRSALQQGRISLLAKGEEAPFMYTQAEFSFDRDNGRPYIIVYSSLIEMYERDPSFTLAQMIPALYTAYNFLALQGDFYSAYQDPIESGLFAIDGVYFQALYIRDALMNYYPDLSDYEWYLVNSLENDRLTTATHTLVGLDQQLAFTLVDQYNGLLEETLGEDQVGDLFFDLRTEMERRIGDAREGENDPYRYNTMVSIYTTRLFAREFLDRLDLAPNGALFSILDELVQWSGEQLRSEAEFMEVYRNSIFVTIAPRSLR